MYHVPLPVKCIYGCSNERGKIEDGKEGRELELSGLLYVCVGEEIWKPMEVIARWRC